MRPKSPKWLEDAVEACGHIAQWTDGLSLADYEGSHLLRSAVERQFEIVGGALLRLERADPETAARIPDYRKIIGFRNRIAHGYDEIDHGQVWEVVRVFLPPSNARIEELLREASS